MTIWSIPLASGFGVNLTSNNIAAEVPASVTWRRDHDGDVRGHDRSCSDGYGRNDHGDGRNRHQDGEPHDQSAGPFGALPEPECRGRRNVDDRYRDDLEIALAGGFTVNLTSNNVAATVPASVTVAQSARTATFTVTTAPVGTSITATITATAGTVAKTAALTVNPPAISSLSLSPTAVTCGSGSTGTVGLTGRLLPVGRGAPVEHRCGGCRSSDGHGCRKHDVGDVQRLDNGGRHRAHGDDQSDLFRGGANGAADGQSAGPRECLREPGDRGRRDIPDRDGGTRGHRNDSGFAVSLTSDNAAATVATSVMVVGGASSATFIVSTSFVGGTTTAQITASAAGATKTAALTINPVPLALASLALNPASLTGGASSTGAVTLTAPAQSGGFVVNLSSDNAAATVPASVTVPGGTTTATFTVATGAMGTVTTATVTATASAVTKAATLTINPPPGAVVGTVRDVPPGSLFRARSLLSRVLPRPPRRTARARSPFLSFPEIAH